MTFTDNYRFGFTLDNVKEELEAHKGIHRIGCSAPTVKQIREMPAQDLMTLLDFWLWESPTLLIPSNQQIREVISVIESRPDSHDCQGALAACYGYVEDS